MADVPQEEPTTRRGVVASAPLGREQCGFQSSLSHGGLRSRRCLPERRDDELSAKAPDIFPPAACGGVNVFIPTPGRPANDGKYNDFRPVLKVPGSVTTKDHWELVWPRAKAGVTLGLPSILLTGRFLRPRRLQRPPLGGSP